MGDCDGTQTVRYVRHRANEGDIVSKDQMWVTAGMPEELWNGAMELKERLLRQSKDDKGPWRVP